MIDYTITMGNLITILGMGGGTLVLAWKLRSALDRRMNTIESDLKQKAAQTELDRLELDMARNYVSVTHLKEVEERMTASMKAVADEVRGLRTDIINLYKDRAGAGS